MARINRLLQKIFTGLIRFYQLFISPILGNRCRFHPTCSHYMTEAIESYGVLHGIWLGLRRLLKCHPFHPGGYDPMPKAPTEPQPTEGRFFLGENNLTRDSKRAKNVRSLRHFFLRIFRIS